ncbi:excinuclease ABC subunit C [Synechocystis sp. PCC 6803]|uniref:UvrABC system protein C n=1 Tax=Synechocystis sp. (strain ATCC 27184 / PCC 6803 / Kazusa) TaxID=1111708 RepID=UVRC_SYNY3|nr:MULTISPECIES: excinuclease ABC subunit UvrC [unclassified Synechocystis]P73580.1 RecName: Full=UvrABC system protein C; Short=Protein UvrC; AltName: Full=Excinuclease ABC subunit C [Synechocystis sp. PCC 6803 substr. Kazusa]BAM51363.1 excinuclease ABC subunit C [Synechocystis sp. PCC 6803] [Bacillus subtilis BEST7613]AGF51309.1 excinuclease ABC subunit C [Synechocystis sp. PCC 6803]ALJ67324.1 excinuclease ABC subunit C [Synechocystis sp. PCC 6803]AVP89168.1 UvrABC system protein C [Synechoc
MVATVSSTSLLEQPELLERRLQEIPQEPGVYFMGDRQGEILYIGKAKKLRTRVRSYFRDSQPHTARIALMVQQVAEIEFIVTDTEAEALALEANLIKQHQPHFNVLLKDDKKYPYVCITWSETYPRIFITRKRRLNQAKDRYYGPYVDSFSLRQTLRLIQRIFPLRQRRQPLFKHRPCLNYDIGRCPGVCQELITPEDYRQTLQKVAMVFQGRTQELHQLLTQQMEKAAADLKFEQAALIRDQINSLGKLNADQKVSLPQDTISRDAIAVASDGQISAIQLFQIRAGRLVGRLGFFADGVESELEKGEVLQRVLEQHYQQVEAVEIPSEVILPCALPDGELLNDWLTSQRGRKVTFNLPQRQTKAELLEMVERNAQYELERLQKQTAKNVTALEDLAEILNLETLPKRIEGYDISHIQGSNAVASQVVFIDGVPAQQYYRHYKIKNPSIKVGHSDDFASLAEVIIRRFQSSVKGKKNQQDWPDLIMIDGGKGQLSAVVKVLKKMDLLDKFTVVSLAKQREEIFLPGESQPLPTHAEQPGVQLLRRLRDEAHRFAVSFHRQQRLSKSRRSRLDEIPGLGFSRQKQLLAHFRSLDYIREASVKQLQEVPGIGPQLAQTIYDYFHPVNS